MKKKWPRLDLSTRVRALEMLAQPYHYQRAITAAIHQLATECQNCGGDPAAFCCTTPRELARERARIKDYKTGDCCTGMNGSHHHRCEVDNARLEEEGPNKARLICWCCGGSFPADWTMIFNEEGGKCFGCEGSRLACHSKVGMGLDVGGLENRADCPSDELKLELRKEVGNEG